MTAPILGITLLLMMAVLAVPRRYALSPFIIVAFFITMDSRFEVMTLDFTPLRMLVLASTIRILLRGELRQVKLCRLDKVVIAWIIVGAVIYMLRWRTMSSVVNRAGYLFDQMGFYLVLRACMRSWEDLDAMLKTVGICLFAFVPLIYREWSTGKNWYVETGQMVIRANISREGEHRCHGPFSHPIMMGLFVASFVPLAVGWALSGGNKLLALVILIGAAFCSYATNSSTPLAAIVLGLFPFAFYKWRGYTKYAFWAIIAMSIFLQFTLKNGVFHVFARIHLIKGSTGWHRYNVINQTIRHFKEWCLLGVKTTAPWGITDITNQYALIGIRGGLITLVLYFIVLYMCFTAVGRLLKPEARGMRDIMPWAIGVAIFCHTVSFMAISYFGGQMIMAELLVIALCAYYAEMVPPKSKNRVRGAPGALT